MLLAAFGVSLLATSGQSFWIDEGNSGFKAIQENFAAFWAIMIQDKGSDLQMPLYMFSIWLWEKLVGSSEFALRAMNIPFFLGSIATVLFALRQRMRHRFAFVVLACLWPMVWIYLDEARPYMFQFCGATLLLVALVNTCSDEQALSLGDLILFCAGSLLLASASLTGVIYVFFFAVLFLWLVRRCLRSIISSPAHLLVIAFAFLLMLALGGYYAWTLKMGARASSAGQTNLVSILFCWYELIGFSGMGPGRNSLRESGILALKPYVFQLGVLSLGLAAFLGCSLAANRQSREVPRRVVLVVCAAAAGGLAILAAGIVMDFRVLGRHLMPFVPFLLYLLAILLCSLFQSPSRVLRTVGSLFLLLLLVSCLQLRFGTRFAKDDYRDAAKVARHAVESGRCVWWAADVTSGRFYGVDIVEPTRPGHAFVANNRDTSFLAALPPADLVVLSKKDIYDPNGHLRTLLQSRGFTVTSRLPAMTIYEQKSQN